MLLDGAYCVGSIWWLNRAHCRSTMHPINTYSSHDVRKRNHRIHSMHKQNDVRSGLFRYFYLKYIYIGKFLDEIATEEYSLSNQSSEI